MLIVCPSCASTYSLTPEQLGQGRTLRCATCRHKWFVAPDADTAPAEDSSPDVEPAAPGVEAAATPPPEAAAPPPRGRTHAAKRTKRKSARTSLATRLGAMVRPSFPLFAALSLIVVVGGGIWQRWAVVRALPHTAALYDAIRLPVNLRGLAFADVRAEIVPEKDQRVLIVVGRIVGVAPGRSVVGPLTVSLRDDSGNMVFEWVTDIGSLSLMEGETTDFAARLVSPPSDGKAVVVRFANRDSRIAVQ